MDHQRNTIKKATCVIQYKHYITFDFIHDVCILQLYKYNKDAKTMRLIGFLLIKSYAKVRLGVFTLYTVIVVINLK